MLFIKFTYRQYAFYPLQDMVLSIKLKNPRLKILWLLVERDPTQRDGLTLDDEQFQGPANDQQIRSN